MRAFATRFWRNITGVFAGDAVPVGAQVLNNPVTGAGVVFRIPILVKDTDIPTTRIQGYWNSSVGALTATLQLYISEAVGTVAGDWIAVGDPLVAVPQNRLFLSAGFIGDADALITITPSAPMVLGDTLDMFLEEMGD